MSYRSIVVTQRGGPEVIKIVENDLRPPAAGEAQIRILASPVCQDDIAVRVGNRPFLAKTPFVPGYSILGEVEATGAGVTQFIVGDRVVALTNFGGHAEMIYWPAAELVLAPPGLDPAEAVVLILNYLVAYQTLHRIAQVKAGDKLLIVGASGGDGSAYLQLGRLAGLTMYGLASRGKHSLLAEYGATLIDYREQVFVEIIHQAEPEGLDFVFNGMGEEYLRPGIAVLRRGGVLVHYGAPQSLSRFLKLMVAYLWFNLLPNGKAIKGYGTHRLGVELFEKDWNTLFNLLDQGKIKPIIAARFPILEARQAYDLLESGQVTGNIVLLAPEFLPAD
jgi:NADPH:quinone reductase-like Zn-dependent oxidoreductase